MGCLFCDIANHEQEAEVVYETDDVTAFRDSNPIAPVHILVVPKRHVPSVADLQEGDTMLAGSLLMAAARIAEQERIADDGYKVLIRVRRHGGQEVDHLHVHLLGGAPLEETIRPAEAGR